MNLVKVSGGKEEKGIEIVHRPPSHPLARREELSGFGLGSLQALVAPLAVPLLLQQRHTGAAHRDGDVDLGVGVATADAGAGSLEDDGGRVDRSAAVLVALLAVRPDQAALTQAVGLGDEAGIPAQVVRNPEIMNATDALFPSADSESVLVHISAMSEQSTSTNHLEKRHLHCFVFLKKKHLFILFIHYLFLFILIGQLSHPQS